MGWLSEAQTSISVALPASSFIRKSGVCASKSGVFLLSFGVAWWMDVIGMSGVRFLLPRVPWADARETG